MAQESADLCKSAAKTILNMGDTTPAEGLISMSLSLAADLFLEEGVKPVQAMVPLVKAAEVVDEISCGHATVPLPRKHVLLGFCTAIEELGQRHPDAKADDAVQRLQNMSSDRPKRNTSTLRWL